MTRGWRKLASCHRAADVRVTCQRIIRMTDGLGHLRGRTGQTSMPLRAGQPLRQPAVTSRPLQRIAKIVYFRSSLLPLSDDPPNPKHCPLGNLFPGFPSGSAWSLVPISISLSPAVRRRSGHLDTNSCLSVSVLVLGKFDFSQLADAQNEWIYCERAEFEPPLSGRSLIWRRIMWHSDVRPQYGWERTISGCRYFTITLMKRR